MKLFYCFYTNTADLKIFLKAMRFASPREGSYQVALSFFLDLKTIPSSFTCERLQLVYFI